MALCSPALELSCHVSGLGNSDDIVYAVQAGSNGAGVGAYLAASHGSSWSSAHQQVSCQGPASYSANNFGKLCGRTCYGCQGISLLWVGFVAKALSFGVQHLHPWSFMGGFGLRKQAD